METMNNKSIPNVISLEDIELNCNPPSLVNPCEMETNQVLATQVEPAQGEPSHVEPSQEPVINLLLQIIENDLVININDLTPEQKNVLKVIMKNSPSSLNDMEKTINSIISDNIINAADIPKFIILIKEFHELIVDNSLNTKFSGEQLIAISVSIIKYILPIIMKKMDLDTEVNVKTMNTLVDASAELLLFIPIMKHGKWNLFCV